MRIGELAERAGVSTKAVRYYESLGLLSAPRLENGYRDFDDRDVSLVREINGLVALGVRAEQARPFVECLVAGNERGHDCPESLEAYRAALAELDSSIEELTRRRAALAELLERASGCSTCGAA
ncbi:DNA-binding transcriptional MerR regulator [Leifsonia sp. AK011]|uniref:MerR family transcriptional regulator n=1 Tax=Leifsonia sp. AK011 TaxID=2723075 RepID=UPI0015CD2D80|nr:MerR family transcriptional regulator [Leifsonia sp. AK011]NYF10567.1 DNA-binding transcriptional MerR regulator [Leifsonia sp. AK011]